MNRITDCPNIEVGVLTAKEISVRLSGKYTLAETKKYLYNNYEISCDKGELVLKSEQLEYRPGKSVSLVPCNLSSDYFEVDNVVIGIDFHWEQKESQRFRGALKLVISGDKILLINIIPLENYLVNVISSEMSPGSSHELMKAHAIISRTWALSKMGKREQSVSDVKTNESTDEYISWQDHNDHAHFHVCADDHCQRYQGRLKHSNPNAESAVRETRGLVLMYHGEICDARYSKSCGGHTEVFSSCWGDEDHPYLQGFADRDERGTNIPDLRLEKNAREFITTNPPAFCSDVDESITKQVLNDYDQPTRDFYRWKIGYSGKELSEIIRNRSGIDFGDIISLEPVERGVSGRLIRLRITGTKKTMVAGKELTIRRWLSESHLYSSAIIIEAGNVIGNIPQKFIISGAGWGHGVGLCQIGAAVMSEKGYNHLQILEHYFPGTEIIKQYS